jgi:hypothetical protein
MLNVELHVRTVVSTVATVVWNVTPCILVGNIKFSDDTVSSAFRFRFFIHHYASIHFPLSSVYAVMQVKQASSIEIIH